MRNCRVNYLSLVHISVQTEVQLDDGGIMVAFPLMPLSLLYFGNFS